MTLIEKKNLKKNIDNIIIQFRITDDTIKKINKKERDVFVNQKLLDLNGKFIEWGLKHNLIRNEDITTNSFFTNNKDLISHLNDIGAIGFGGAGIGGAAVAYNVAAAPVFLGFGGGIGAIGAVGAAVIAAPLVISGIAVFGIMKYKENKVINELIKKYDEEILKVSRFYKNRINSIQTKEKANTSKSIEIKEKANTSKSIEIKEQVHIAELVKSIMSYTANIDGTISEKENSIIDKETEKYLINSSKIEELNTNFIDIKELTINEELELFYNNTSIEIHKSFYNTLYGLVFSNLNCIQEKITFLKDVATKFKLDNEFIDQLEKKHSLSEIYENEFALLAILIQISKNLNSISLSAKDLIKYEYFPDIKIHQILKKEYKNLNSKQTINLDLYKKSLSEDQTIYFELFYKISNYDKEVSKENKALLDDFQKYFNISNVNLQILQVKYFNVNDKTLVYYINSNNFGIKDETTVKNSNHGLTKNNFFDKVPQMIDQIFGISNIKINFIGDSKYKNKLEE
ncbi:MAG: hypothetical protein ACERKK_07850, partial [Poseidonibacter sp.]|uniref:hypothetical protein n=1 Tax=Poseidonibacter sp. TaxID=2321188 RepID=UPI00359E94A4